MPPRSMIVDGGVVGGRIAFDAVAGEADHRRRSPARGRPALCSDPVAEAVARRHRRPAPPARAARQQRLVGAGDADRDRLGLVLDGVDRAGELLDARVSAAVRSRPPRSACRSCRTRAGRRRAARHRWRSGAATRAAPPCSPRGGRRRRRVRRPSKKRWRRRLEIVAAADEQRPSALDGDRRPRPRSPPGASRSGRAWASMASAAS